MEKEENLLQFVTLSGGKIEKFSFWVLIPEEMMIIYK